MTPLSSQSSYENIEEKKHIGLLSLDGGGVRGLLTLTVCADIEKDTNRKISEIFTNFAGASIGSFICLGLAFPSETGKSLYSAQELSEIFEKEVSHVFTPASRWNWFSTIDNLARPKYTPQGIDALCQKYFHDTPFASAIGEVHIPAGRLSEASSIYFFSSTCAKKHNPALTMKDVVLAATAAPTYFPPHVINMNGEDQAFADGGLFDNNPSVSGYLDVKKRFGSDACIDVLSIGTGQVPCSVSYTKAQKWGLAAWGVNLLGLMFNYSSNMNHHLMRQIVHEDGHSRAPHRYVRLQTEIESKHGGLDDISAANLAYLKTKGHELFEKERDNMEPILRKLLDSEALV